jgi:hypothetical protein
MAVCWRRSPGHEAHFVVTGSTLPLVVPRLDLQLARSLRVSWEQADDPTAKAIYERTAAEWLGAGDAGTLVLAPGAATELRQVLET